MLFHQTDPCDYRTHMYISYIYSMYSDSIYIYIYYTYIYIYIHCILSINLLQFCGSCLSWSFNFDLGQPSPSKMHPSHRGVCKFIWYVSLPCQASQAWFSIQAPYTTPFSDHTFKNHSRLMKTSISHFRTSWASQGISRIWYAGTQDNCSSGILRSVPALPQNFHPLSRSLWHFHWHHLMTQNDMNWRPRGVIHDNTFECHQNWQHHCSHGTGQTRMFEWYWCILFVRPKLLANVTTSIQKLYAESCWRSGSPRTSMICLDMFGCSLFRNQWKKMCRNPMVHNVSTLRTL